MTLSNDSVMVVDDERSQRQCYERALTALGYRVQSVGDAASALLLIETVRPAVIVCDVHMPGHNGLWLADQIRQRFPTIAIVLATGDSYLPPAQTLRRGIMAYLLKPLTLADLARAITEGFAWSVAEQRQRAARADLQRGCLVKSAAVRAHATFAASRS